MIYKYNTTIGISYYQDSETYTIFMSVEDYCILAKKSIASVSSRKSETISLSENITKPGDGKPKIIELITQKTIIQWLMKDCPELILQLLINGFQNFLDDATED